MEIKEVKQTKVFGKEVRTNLKSIAEHVKVLPETILAEMNTKGIQMEGPQVWIYNGADGNPDTDFDLLVGFPIAKEMMGADITALEDFKCATIVHKGNWSALKDSYCKIVSEVTQSGLQMSGECREIYHAVDFENVENNVTEIQIGIK